MKQVEIMSTTTITVTPDLKVRDLTDKHSTNPNKLRATIDWKESPIMIIEGKGLYPQQIVEWESVQNLVKANVFTIGQVVGEETQTNETNESTETNETKKNQNKNQNKNKDNVSLEQ